MDAGRPPSTTSAGCSSSNVTSELFICFTSGLSSSSVKISSKFILSPCRGREPSQISLSSSFSKRLRRNGSLKGGQASPMFPEVGKKRGSALENPEPSSPKVTCIGQVRVKTKKQGKKIRARSNRRGEVSFRKMEHSSNGGAGAATPSTNSFGMGSHHQDYNMGHFLHSSSHQQQQQECRKWLHFPLTICEALRAFGAEFNCFLPCRSSCTSNQREKEDKAAGSDGDSNRKENRSSCGHVFGRWLVAVQEGKGKDREIELVVGEEDRRGRTEMQSSQRRHIFEDIEIKDEKMGEEEARVSICIPPKNALLLMRCRSDPVKMAALANRFWESPVPKDEEEEGNVDEDGEKVEEAQPTFDEHEMEHEMGELCRKSLSSEAAEEQEISGAEAETEQETEFALDGEGAEEQENQERNLLIDNLEEQRSIEYLEDQENEIENQLELAEESSSEYFADPEQVVYEENVSISPENEYNPEEETPGAESENGREDIDETISNKQECSGNENEEQEAEIQPIAEETEEEETVTSERSEPGCQDTQEPVGVGSNEKAVQQKLLPDCLLLMMCEPKLSMEVSEETWVCSEDFIRWLPERPPPPVNKKKDGRGNEPKRRISIDYKPSPQFLQPPRSSCSFPVAPPMAVAAAAQGPGNASMSTMIEQKLVGGKGYEPCVLTRCKSEPMRSAAKFAPDACFWKSRKLEPAKIGVGAAEVGF